MLSHTHTHTNVLAGMERKTDPNTVNQKVLTFRAAFLCPNPERWLNEFPRVA